MMDAQGSLAIAAEIGIGVAGFSSIATAILSRSLCDNNRVHWIQLRTLLQTSLAVVVLAYLPMVLSATALRSSDIWLNASGVYIIWTIFVFGIGIVGLPPLWAVRGLTRALACLTVVLGLTSLAFNVSNAFVFREAWPYLAALTCGLLIAFLQFSQLVRGLWSTQEHAKLGDIADSAI